jgi:tRNA A-37 threonylcarbamoyl transferase component Bud32
MVDVVDDRFCLVGVVVDGRFAIDRAVAEGGSGTVYRARHIELDAPVALKVLRVPPHLRGLEAALEARFRQEARTLALLPHPAIVRVLDVGQLHAQGASCVWMALEWLDGETLDAHLGADARRRSPREALALLAPVLDAIASAHERGVVHRDLKPSNIMVVPSARGEPDLRVLDFGIAKAMLPDDAPCSGQTETQSDLAAFSLPYAAPEQVGRMRTGPWTDVHALGLLLTEVLTGRAPYAGDDSFALYASIMCAERPTPSRRGVPVGPWELILARALALHPRERFASARALYDALRASADDAQRAAEGAPPPRARVRPRWAARAVAAILLLTLSAGAVALRSRGVAATAPTPSLTAAPREAVARERAPAPRAEVPSAPTRVVHREDAPLRPHDEPARRASARPLAARPPRVRDASAAHTASADDPPSTEIVME